MRIAYLILVHRNPKLLKRAISVLSSENATFFVHVDRKSAVNQFLEITSENVYFTEPRIPVYWGEFSQVEATLLLIEQALRSQPRCDYLVFLQGSDYPLRSGSYIQRFLETNRGLEFLSLTKMPAPGYAMSKINLVRYSSKRPVGQFATKVLGKLGLARRDCRKYLSGLEPYAGQACWALSREACSYLLEFRKAHPHIERFFRDTLTSDEMFFHTILGNSPFLSQTRRNLMYLDWSARGAHPATLSEMDVKSFEGQDKVWVEDEWGAGELLFARKFSDDTMDLVERIDRMIFRKGS